jgi:hypothetical protein
MMISLGPGSGYPLAHGLGRWHGPVIGKGDENSIRQRTTIFLRWQVHLRAAAVTILA